MKKILFLMILLIVIAAPVTSVAAKPARVVTDAFSLIAEVNAFRAANGLPAYSISPILMYTAQAQADYNASIGKSSHIGPDGSTASQRLLAAGYPLAGDLSLGGFKAENITGGINKSVQQAVLEWQGDYDHWHTMTSPDLMEIGAGVAYVGEHVYYVIDCARPTGSKQPQNNTPVPGETKVVINVGPPLARTVIPNTPSVDGKIYHIVGPGETLWLIAISYGVKIAEIRQLNYMTESEAIYPGDKLLIREDAIPSGQDVSDTPAPATPELATPSKTPWATFTHLPTLEQALASETSQDTFETPLTPYPTSTLTGLPAAVASPDSSVVVLGAIVLAALVLAGVLARAGRQA